MANVVVAVDLRDESVTAPTVFAVGEARRVADALGATVYALVVTGPLGGDAIERITADLGRAGGDRVLFCVDGALAGAPLDPTHGPVVTLVVERLRPLLFLFPAGGSAPALAPPLAVRTGAAFCPHASLEIETAAVDEGETIARVVVRRWRPGGDGARAIDVVDLERPVIATLAAGRASGPVGQPAADAQMLSYPDGASAALEELAGDPDENAAVEVAHALIVVDAGDAGALATIRAALPAGMAAVADGAATIACPHRLLILTNEAPASWPGIAFAPTARLALVGPKGAEKGIPADLVLRPAKGNALEALVGALSDLTRGAGE